MENVENIEAEETKDLEPYFKEFLNIFSGSSGDVKSDSIDHVEQAFARVGVHEIPTPILMAIELLNTKPENAMECADLIMEWSAISSYLGTLYARANNEISRMTYFAMPDDGTIKDKSVKSEAACANYKAVRDIIRYLFLASFRVTSQLQSLLKLEREEFSKYQNTDNSA